MGSLPVSAELLVIGADPVGLFAAFCLGQIGIRVTVLEKESGLSQLPRACMFYPQPQFALADAGIWKAIIKGGGFRSTGIDIRLPPTPDGNDRKVPGQIVGSFPKDPNHDPLGTSVRPPAISMLNMAQPEFTKILMQSALETGAATYTIHQRLASKLRHGRCLLAGDAVHVNNVIGGLGLSNCLMEAVALSDALILVLEEGKPANPVLTMHSDERRQVFQFFIDPVSSWSKLRIQAGEHDDWFFRCLKDTSSAAFERWIDMMENFWPTRIKDMAKVM
ncbi:hypothetical protein CORC01_06578 [Colletotrichum orchidophilum]|uniref:FAD-binding domain-containing protein n=1 Tax=Colletotrichum orchidophilum TaxID=1209926 RepID=A0A1G4B9H4_9PEZI|nr:uncharacterized protein CORC01_06578 [Colletotrichum orchidophilum]OHE98064.1 hypothetical protein CORC01_06578 [Colletotrichum orchidophilum]